MNSDASTTAPPPAGLPESLRVKRTRRRVASRVSLLAHGEPMVWLTGGAMAVALTMIVVLLAMVFWQGLLTFWPAPAVRVETETDEVFLGEVSRDDRYEPGENVFESLPEEVAADARAAVAADDGWATRRLIRTGNVELTGTHFTWVDDFLVREETEPEWAVVVERLSRGQAAGRFYGELTGFAVDGEATASAPQPAWEQFQLRHAEALARNAEQERIKQEEIAPLSRQQETARLAEKGALQERGPDSAEHVAAREELASVESTVAEQTAILQEKIQELVEENDRYEVLFRIADGREARLFLGDVVRAYPANRLTWSEKWGVYTSRWAEFLTADPRESNSEGGVFPAIFGTVVMTLLMSLAVVPFGVLAAMYLREYAKRGPVVSAVRISINNLAGVPSIVFGVFGLGFFCYVLGGGLDELFFPVRTAAGNPTFGTGGVMWASLTLALLTLPVVIVATEEALAAVPNSMREGSYACGASKWQTIRRIVLPRAMPGIMTGMILAMARGAGEVAPLMLVGAVKLAPDLVLDGVFPYLHPERSFMHLGFHIYDVGFQSQNSEAAKPMVFTTTLLLIAIIALLNVTAVWLRARLRRKFVSNQF